MTAPVSITRTDGTPADLHDAAWKSKSVTMALRLMTLAMLLRGVSRSMAAETFRVTVRVLGNWIARYTGTPSSNGRPALPFEIHRVCSSKIENTLSC